MRMLQVISPLRTRSRRRLVKTMGRVYCETGEGAMPEGRGGRGSTPSAAMRFFCGICECQG